MPKSLTATPAPLRALSGSMYSACRRFRFVETSRPRCRPVRPELLSSPSELTSMITGHCTTSLRLRWVARPRSGSVPQAQEADLSQTTTRNLRSMAAHVDRSASCCSATPSILPVPFARSFIPSNGCHSNWCRAVIGAVTGATHFGAIE